MEIKWLLEKVMEIKFYPKNVEDEAVLATRVAHAIGIFDDFCPPFEKDSGYKWQLDASNDWWMSPCLEDGHVVAYIVAYRYWSNLEMLEKVQDKLREVFE